MPPQHAYRALPGRLKDELETELNQSWVRAGGCTGYHAKVCGSNAGVGRRKLRTVEEVKELGPKLQPQLVVGAKLGPFEQGEVKVVHTGAAKIGIGAGLIAEC